MASSFNALGNQLYYNDCDASIASVLFPMASMPPAILSTPTVSSSSSSSSLFMPMPSLPSTSSFLPSTGTLHHVQQPQQHQYQTHFDMQCQMQPDASVNMHQGETVCGIAFPGFQNTTLATQSQPVMHQCHALPHQYQEQQQQQQHHTSIYIPALSQTPTPISLYTHNLQAVVAPADQSGVANTEHSVQLPSLYFPPLPPVPPTPANAPHQHYHAIPSPSKLCDDASAAAAAAAASLAAAVSAGGYLIMPHHALPASYMGDIAMQAAIAADPTPASASSALVQTAAAARPRLVTPSQDAKNRVLWRNAPLCCPTPVRAVPLAFLERCALDYDFDNDMPGVTSVASCLMPMGAGLCGSTSGSVGAGHKRKSCDVGGDGADYGPECSHPSKRCTGESSGWTVVS
ncbi:hypothetical protein BC831DRAFT_70488 [Entophlyctis helioformis]|nr:hypothetical protein BC831DRAFT_213592 [Entophlyctis helioformis]KAI8928868.1 hypothetical protein BC831DRAFT_70488 [Entophlyctis helioformis]